MPPIRQFLLYIIKLDLEFLQHHDVMQMNVEQSAQHTQKLKLLHHTCHDQLTVLFSPLTFVVCIYMTKIRWLLRGRYKSSIHHQSHTIIGADRSFMFWITPPKNIYPSAGKYYLMMSLADIVETLIPLTAYDRGPTQPSWNGSKLVTICYIYKQERQKYSWSLQITFLVLPCFNPVAYFQMGHCHAVEIISLGNSYKI